MLPVTTRKSHRITSHSDAGHNAMRWSSRFWHGVAVLYVRGAGRWVRLTLPGWEEHGPTRNLRIWRNGCGDVLSLGTLLRGDDPPQAEDALTPWCREIATGNGDGTFQVQVDLCHRFCSLLRRHGDFNGDGNRIYE